MPHHQDIAFNVTGQSLYRDCMEGRPSSVTSVTVFPWNVGDDGQSESATSGSASIDSVSTTFRANSGVSSSDPTLLNLTSTTGIVLGRDYLVTNASGEFEWVDIQAIVSGSTASSRNPLYNDYISTDTFVSTRISISVSSTWVADNTKISSALLQHPGYRVRWVYVVGGVSYVRTSYFDLTRAPAGHGVTAASIERLLPGFMYSLPNDHQEDQARSFLDEAYRQFRIDLYQEQIDDASVRDADIIDEMVMRKAIHMWAEMRVHVGGGSDVSAERAKADYVNRFMSLFKAPTQAKVPIADSSSGGGSYVSATRVTVR